MFLTNEENLKKRHIALTLYLYFTLILGVFLLKNDLQKVFSEPDFDNIFLLTFGIIDVTLTIMLLNWKKWAFYGLLISSSAIMVFNLVKGYGIMVALLGFSGFILIYILLLLRKNGKSGWQHLE